ncbi:MAG: PEP/pyruvate-binding domain-containing protein [Pseudomonadota bacterium]
MSADPALTLPLETPVRSLEMLGGKGLSLSRLLAAGFDVPGGFHVTTQAYWQFVRENNLESRLETAARPRARNGVLAFDEAEEQAQALILDAPMPPGVQHAICQAYRAIGGQNVAVRSSATAEDLPEFSFAGQQDTFLNVQGEDALVEHIQLCWASLWTSRAISYRFERGFEPRDTAMAVVVQTMVSAEVSGVLFTANPLTGERSEMLVNASYGLGEAIVSGAVTPDTFLIDRVSGQIRERTLGAKAIKIVTNGNSGTREESVADAERATATLNDSQLHTLCDIASRVEANFNGQPQDIEWLLAGGEFQLLQSRPVTNLPAALPREVRWEPPAENALLLRRQLVEHIPGPVSPLFESLYLFDALQRAATGDSYEKQKHRIIHPTVNGFAFKRVGGPEMEQIPRWWRRQARDQPEPSTAPWVQRGREAIKRLTFTLRYYRNTPKRWRERTLPAYQTAIQQCRDIEPSTAADETLLDSVRKLALADATYWFSGTAGLLVLTRQIEARLQGLLQTHSDSELNSGAFLTGLPSRARESQRRLAVIADVISSNTELTKLFSTTPPAKLMAMLRAHPEAGIVNDLITAYLDLFGHQSHTLDFAEPNEADNPLPMLLGIRAWVLGARRHTAGLDARLAKSRRQAHWRALKVFGWRYPAFLWTWALARHLYPWREEALFHVGEAWPLLRRFALELGRRLVDAGALSVPDDVFYLTMEELTEACQTGRRIRAPRFQAVVAERKALQASRARLDPPFQIPAPEPEDAAHEMDMWGITIKGGTAAYNMVNNTAGGTNLRGFPCSPGVVTAEATVILSPADFHLMKPGTILVCPATTPVWTELFSIAAGLVTDTGGILAHGSIVAREYGIPAVLGTGDVTRRIETGSVIKVDGNRGIVTLAESTPAPPRYHPVVMENERSWLDSH